VLELLRAAERPDVDRPQAGVGDELRYLPLGLVVVAGDQDVERLAGDLASDERAGKGRVERLTTDVPSGTSWATSSADDVPGGVARLSQVSVSTGFVRSTTTLPASWSAYWRTASLMPGY
jgi:hypothetical protein